LSSKVFAHLCDIVDDDGTRFTKELQQISKQIILEGNLAHFCPCHSKGKVLQQIMWTEKSLFSLKKHFVIFWFTGAEVFFPDTDTRRNHLLSMVDQVMGEGKAVSLAMTFESLCRFFSNKDASGLLGLPEVLPEVCLDITIII
jgi:hypothetical protein